MRCALVLSVVIALVVCASAPTSASLAVKLRSRLDSKRIAVLPGEVGMNTRGPASSLKRPINPKAMSADPNATITKKQSAAMPPLKKPPPLQNTLSGKIKNTLSGQPQISAANAYSVAPVKQNGPLPNQKQDMGFIRPIHAESIDKVAS